MSEESLLNAINKSYQKSTNPKVTKYVDAFYDKTKKGMAIRARVEGNHGAYRVSIRAKDDYLESACSCYIGKHGGCHHTTALALNYKAAPDSFEEQAITPKSAVKNMKTLGAYIKGTTLEELLEELKSSKGITQAAFARSIGMSSRHLTTVKTSEMRNRDYKELGAIKLACLYVLERKKIKD